MITVYDGFRKMKNEIQCKDIIFYQNHFPMSKSNISNGRLQHLKKVLAVQKIYLEHAPKEYPKKYIFNKFIKDVFYISERTFWRYLDTNAKREIKQIEAALNLDKSPEMVENTN